jgi:hypothetical protein
LGVHLGLTGEFSSEITGENAERTNIAPNIAPNAERTTIAPKGVNSEICHTYEYGTVMYAAFLSSRDGNSRTVLVRTCAVA